MGTLLLDSEQCGLRCYCGDNIRTARGELEAEKDTTAYLLFLDLSLSLSLLFSFFLSQSLRISFLEVVSQIHFHFFFLLS